MVKIILAISILVFVGCRKDQASAPIDPQEELIRKGRQAYVSHCIACHATNPQKDGAIGPAIWNSSLELLEAKVLKGAYPPGYSPKRTTAAMAPLPHTQEQIPAIHAYLNSINP